MQVVQVCQQNGGRQKCPHGRQPHEEGAGGGSARPRQQQARAQQAEHDQGPGRGTADTQIGAGLLVNDRIREQKLVQPPINIQGVLPDGGDRQAEHHHGAAARQEAAQDTALGARAQGDGAQGETDGAQRLRCPLPGQATLENRQVERPPEQDQHGHREAGGGHEPHETCIGTGWRGDGPG